MNDVVSYRRRHAPIAFAMRHNSSIPPPPNPKGNSTDEKGDVFSAAAPTIKVTTSAQSPPETAASFSSETDEDVRTAATNSASAADSELSTRLALIGDELYGAAYQPLKDSYAAALEAEGDAARDHSIEQKIARHELAAFQRVSLLCIQRAWMLIAIFGGYAVFTKTQKATEGEANNNDDGANSDVDKASPSQGFSTSPAQEALMGYLGSLSVAAGAAIAAVYMPLVGIMLTLDYGYVMWSRNFKGKHLCAILFGGSGGSTSPVYLGQDTSTPPAQHAAPSSTAHSESKPVAYSPHGSNIDYHEEVVTKAFPLWLASALVTNYILFFVQLHMARRGKVVVS